MKIRTITTTLALALLPIVSPKAETIYILSSLDQIISFDSATPGNLISARGITGLESGETLVGLDARPANGTLYALGNSSRVYTIDPNTGIASSVNGPFSPLLNGTAFGFDFNPTVDRIRITTDFDQNLRANPNDGTVIQDGTLAYVSGDPAFGESPSVSAVAYSNNVANATATTLYGIDNLRNTLVRFQSANAGTLQTVGPLSIDAARLNGFDISAVSGVAYAVTPAASGDPAANLYTIDLGTGVATIVGKIGDADTSILVRGMTVFAPIPEPGVTALLAFGGGFGGFMLWRRQRSKR